jgi:transcriptional regulator with XRE-family HTH domain
MNNDQTQLQVREPLCVCERIRLARSHAGLTKIALAQQVGVCVSAAVQWEHPRGTVPSVSNLLRIAAITGVAFEWLATGRGAALLGRDSTVAVTPLERHLLAVARGMRSDQHGPLLDRLAEWIKELEGTAPNPLASTA